MRGADIVIYDYRAPGNNYATGKNIVVEINGVKIPAVSRLAYEAGMEHFQVFTVEFFVGTLRVEYCDPEEAPRNTKQKDTEEFLKWSADVAEDTWLRDKKENET